MSAVIAVPELMAEAATDLATVGSNLSAAHMTAAAPTVAVLPAAADEVSAGIAHLFSGYGQDYQTLAGNAAASYEHFVQHLTTSAGAYASAEAANAALLHPLTASAGSIGSAIGAFWDQLVNSVNDAVGQLTGFLGSMSLFQLYESFVFFGFFGGLILVFGIPFALALALWPILYPILSALGPFIDATLTNFVWPIIGAILGNL